MPKILMPLFWSLSRLLVLFKINFVRMFSNIFLVSKVNAAEYPRKVLLPE